MNVVRQATHSRAPRACRLRSPLRILTQQRRWYEDDYGSIPGADGYHPSRVGFGQKGPLVQKAYDSRPIIRSTKMHSGHSVDQGVVAKSKKRDWIYVSCPGFVGRYNRSGAVEMRRVDSGNWMPAVDPQLKMQIEDEGRPISLTKADELFEEYLVQHKQTVQDHIATRNQVWLENRKRRLEARRQRLIAEARQRGETPPDDISLEDLQTTKDATGDTACERGL